jgi:hypothetical protein
MNKTILLLLVSIFICSCTDNREKVGEEIYLKIVQYRNSKGHLPDSLGEMGVEEKIEGPIYYTKQSDSTFIIYYSRGLGESIIYEPKTGKWR